MKCTKSKSIIRMLITIVVWSACTGSPPISPNPPETTTPTLLVSPRSEPTLAPLLLGDYELLQPEDMRYDLDELFHRIESTHPNPYANRPKEEVDLERQRVHDELSLPMTMVEFYKKVAPLVNSLGEYHIQVFLTDDIFDGLYEKELFFPFILAAEADRVYIVSNFSNNAGIENNTELLAVNDTPVLDLLLEAERFFPAGDPFHPFLFLFHFGSTPDYQLDVIPAGKAAPVRFTVPSMASDQIQQKASTNPPSSQSNDPVMYETLPDQDIGILTVDRFWGIGPLLHPAFVRIQEDKVQHLILDIRSNGGGKYEDVDALMNYLTDQPYRWCSRSLEAPFGGYGSGGPREKECELIQPFNSAEQFEGKLYLLIGPDTLSAAITFATILQDYNLATLVGEPTGDLASYCGNIPDISPLPRTKLLHFIARTCYVRPSGILDDLPVIPDIIIDTTLADRLAGQNPVLQSTLEIIRNSKQSQ